MCGVLFTDKPSITEHQFKSALYMMEHRGPDAVGCYAEDGRRKMGHNRLKIVDLDDRSNQPFVSGDGRYKLIFNGEIYNFQELAKAHRLQLSTKSDTEVLLQLFIKLGPKVLDLLNGMFAFVVLDTISGSYFAARDRLGVKPLYYMKTDGGIIISSEISPILKLAGRVEIDEFGLRQYKKLRTFFNGRTLHKGISMLPAGSYMQDGKLTTYWRLPYGEQSAPTDEELRDLIEDAVRCRLVSDVEVGSYLSGGIDSTIVAGLSQKPHTWTVGTESNNEFKWARIAADKFGSTHHEVLMDDDEFLTLARDLITVRQEPLSVPNEVLLYKMTQEVKKYNTVVLSGEGADELFFGYDRIFRWAQASKGFDLREFDKHYSYGSHTDDEVVEDALAPFMDRGSPVDIVAAFFQVAHLHGLLRRVDNSTMRCSVEARVPFVDHRLVERMAGVSFDYRMQDGIVKAPLKRIFTDLLPESIIERKKVGFPVDLDSIFRGRSNEEGSAMDRWLKFNLEVLGIED